MRATLIVAAVLSCGLGARSAVANAAPPPVPAPAEDFEKVREELSTARPVPPRTVNKARTAMGAESVSPVLPVIGDAWEFQGPAPGHAGQVEGIPNRPISGAIHTVLAHPSEADILYIGAVNGGVWKTTNARSASPTWTALLDTAESLSIGALEADPTDPSFQTIVAAVGRFSSFSRNGGPRAGLLRTTDGGASWTLLTGGGALNGRNFSGVAPRGSTIVAAANFIAGCTSPGLYRSTDTGISFVKVSGAADSGLPGGEVFDLAGHPVDPAVLYLAIRNAATCTPGGMNGVYKSSDTGATWSKVSSAAMDALMANDTVFNNAELAVGALGQVFAGIMNNGRMLGLFRSADGGASWTTLDTPSTNEGGTAIGIQPNEHPGAQGSIHFSIAADPVDPNVVYVGGDRQPGNGDGTASFPNSIGAVNYSGRLFRVDASQPPGSQGQSLTHCAVFSSGCPALSTTSNSAPHADSREMVFDALGDMIEVDDGGVYRRTNPRGIGDWHSVNGTLGVGELHNVAYDTVSNMMMSGSQDNGTAEQRTVGDPTWTLVSQGDGGDVQADDRTSPTQSIRYSSSQNLGGFRRRVVNAAGTTVSTVFPPRTVLGGPAFVGQFVTPVEINAAASTRLLIAGSNDLYESLDRGDTITALGFNRAAPAMVFGGASGGVPNPDLIYAINGPIVYVRTTGGGAPIPTLGVAGSGTSALRDVTADPSDWTQVYVINGTGQVFASPDTGATWTNVAGNLAMATTDLRTIVFVPGAPSAILVGGQGGVFRMAVDSPGVWNQLGTGMPNVPVWDLDYDPVDDVVAAGTLGRGAWKIAGASVPSTPTLSIDDVVVSESDGPGSAVFRVTLRPAATATVTVDYATADGSATGGSDYTAVSGTLAFAAGVTVQTVTVPIVGDASNEPDETFAVNLSGAVGAPIAKPQGLGAIVDDDKPGIAGTIRDAVTGLPLTGITVNVYTSAGAFLSSASTDGFGRYLAASGFTAGTYFVRTTNGLGYVNELYNDIVCLNCLVTAGAPITVAGNAITDGIDFALQPGGRISGRVTDADTATGIGNMTVAVYSATGTGLLSASTDAAGNYSLSNLPTGSYRVRTHNSAGYVDELYDDIPCAPCTISDGTPVSVTAPSTTTGIGFALVKGGRIAGTIRDAATAPLSGITVEIYNATGSGILAVFTGADGGYTIAGLPTGSYLVRTRNSAGYVDELYDDVTCIACSTTSGTPVSVTAGSTTSGIDFALVAGGRISGRITDSSSGAPLPQALVRIYDSRGFVVTTATADATGQYVSRSGLTTGTYFVRASRPGYADGLFDGFTCMSCDVTAGTPVAVTLPSTTSGIDLSLFAGPSVFIDDFVSGEGDVGPTSAVFVVRLSSPSPHPVTVAFSTADGTATAGADYTATGGTVTFPPGTTSQLVTIEVIGDLLDELHETFTVSLSAPVGAVLEDAQGVGTIVDDDEPPVLSIGDAVAREGNGTVEMAVTLSAPSGQRITVDFATADGTARAGSDYTAVSGTLTFDPGTVRRTIAVPILQDAAHEPAETFTVQLSGAVLGVIADGQAIGTIDDDDAIHLSPVADATVRNGLFANVNFGRLRDLGVKDSAVSTFTRRSYLRFDLGAFRGTTARHAVLRLFLRDIHGRRPRLKVYSVTNDSWSETRITWRNQPGRAALLTSARPAAGWVELDVTAFVESQQAGDDQASFVLLDDTDSETLLTFHSREAADRRPELVVEP